MMSQHFPKYLERGYLSQDELGQAIAASQTGTPDFTLGYELELPTRAATEIPRIRSSIEIDPAQIDTNTRAKIRLACENELSPLGFSVGNDALYELRSCPVKHPLEASLATKGIVKAGWLPLKLTMLTAAHINLGTTASADELVKLENSFIRLTRIAEMAGGTTTARLLAPLRACQSTGKGLYEVSWTQKGFLGVKHDGWEHTYNWQGPSNRVEFRTLRYIDHEQFSRTLELMYYLGRGVTSQRGSPAFRIYTDLEGWFRDYQTQNNLPDIDTADASFVDDLWYPHGFESYIKPYALHLAKADKTPLHIRLSKTVCDLQEEFGMQGLQI